MLLSILATCISCASQNPVISSGKAAKYTTITYDCNNFQIGELQEVGGVTFSDTTNEPPLQSTPKELKTKNETPAKNVVYKFQKAEVIKDYQNAIYLTCHYIYPLNNTGLHTQLVKVVNGNCKVIKAEGFGTHFMCKMSVR